MAKKKSLRRALAGILAVLTVTGNMLAPTGIGKQLAETAIVAEAVDSSDVQLNSKGYAFVDGTLYINGVIKTTRDFLDIIGTTQNIDLSNGTTGIRNLNKNNIQNVVIMGGAILPEDSNRLFKDFTNLKTVVVEQGASFSGNSDTYTHLSSLFENCTSLESVDLSGLTDGNRVAYIDGIFENCPNLVSADLSSITGEMMGNGNGTQNIPLFAIDPVDEATDGDDKLAELNFADSFVYNTVNNLANATSDSMHMTPETLLDHLLKGCANKDQFKAQLLEQYNRYEAGQNYEAPVYTWSDDHMQCTATRKHKGNGATIIETVDAEVTVTAPATCTEAGSKTYRAVFTNTTHFNPVTYTEDIPATGHSFDTFAGFVWTEDFTSAQAELKCKDCDATKLVDAEMSEVTSPATCTANSITVYTAAYGDESDSREVVNEGTMLE
ncbi:MAG TPA: hypothetical protein DCP68_07530, partial [Ruminococcus sp.]|nr:hypothetical protein [Ruminococcus sp.]